MEDIEAFAQDLSGSVTRRNPASGNHRKHDRPHRNDATEPRLLSSSEERSRISLAINQHYRGTTLNHKYLHSRSVSVRIVVVRTSEYEAVVQPVGLVKSHPSNSSDTLVS